MSGNDYYMKFKSKMLAELQPKLRTQYGRDCECGGRYLMAVELQEPDDLVRVRLRCDSCKNTPLDVTVADPDDLYKEFS